MPIKLFYFTVALFVASSSAQLIPPNITQGLCSLLDNPPVCPDTYDPVCVLVSKVCDLIPCPYVEDSPNPCKGCLLPEGGIFTYGKCQYSCQPNNLLPAWIHPDADMTVCGSYQQDCQDSSCRKEFSRINFACVDPSVLYFTLGDCSDNEIMEETGEMESEELGLEEEFSTEDEWTL